MEELVNHLIFEFFSQSLYSKMARIFWSPLELQFVALDIFKACDKIKHTALAHSVNALLCIQCINEVHFQTWNHINSYADNYTLHISIQYTNPLPLPHSLKLLQCPPGLLKTLLLNYLKILLIHQSRYPSYFSSHLWNIFLTYWRKDPPES